MKRRRWVLAGTIVLALWILSAPSSLSMVFLVGGPAGTAEEPSLGCEDDESDNGNGNGNGGGQDDEESEACSSMEDWNPTVHCPVEAGDDIHDLLDCLLDQILNPPPSCPPTTVPQPDGLGENEQPEDIMQGGSDTGVECSVPMDREDFIVTLAPAPYYGLEITKLDGSEIERFSFLENFPGLQTVDIELQLSRRVARIGVIEERPSGSGAVHVTVNRRAVTIDTAAFPSAVQVTAELLRLLSESQFKVEYHDGYVFVLWDRLQGTGINHVQFRSTDPAIRSSNVSLLPPDAPELTPLQGLTTQQQR